MIVKIETWKISKLINMKDKINPEPKYQRSEVWTLSKKQLLIDSILRGYDLPKFYLSETQQPSFDYEVTDGQQRVRSIWEYAKGEFPITIINSQNIKEKKLFNDLPDESKKLIKDFKLTISLLKSPTEDEKRTLFARLQMGMQLNQAELRHAIQSNIGNAIQGITLTHKVFILNESKIQNIRYKHQDYIDHVIALMHYNGTQDLKANTLRKLYERFRNSHIDEFSSYLQQLHKILDCMFKINQYSKGIFVNKWGFIDIVWLLKNNYNKIDNINHEEFCDLFKNFENDRKFNDKKPEVLIENKNSTIYDKNLYIYIMAFKYQGGLKDNIKKRYNTLKLFFDSNMNWGNKNV